LVRSGLRHQMAPNVQVSERECVLSGPTRPCRSERHVRPLHPSFGVDILRSTHYSTSGRRPRGASGVTSVRDDRAMSWSDVEELDYRRALHIFRLRHDAIPEVLCRRVLQLIGAGVTYPSIPRDQHKALLTWCITLGARGPEWDDWWDLTIVDTVVRDASRTAALDLFKIVGDDRAGALARRLLPAAEDRRPVAVLSALGYRALAKLVRTVDPGEHAAAADNEHLRSREDDRYDEMEQRLTRWGDDAPPEWEIEETGGGNAPA
jgi:hypothetical protein